MKLKVIRFSDSADDTLGMLLLDDKFFCFTLEDEYRHEKVSGETRIPDGIYQLGIQHTLTPMTISYRKRRNWFENHLHIKNVPNFTSIYIHIGNDDEDTAGCLLVGYTSNSNTKGNGSINYSARAFKDLYLLVYPLLKNGEGITIEFTTIKKLLNDEKC